MFQTTLFLNSSHSHLINSPNTNMEFHILPIVTLFMVSSNSSSIHFSSSNSLNIVFKLFLTFTSKLYENNTKTIPNIK